MEIEAYYDDLAKQSFARALLAILAKRLKDTLAFVDKAEENPIVKHRHAEVTGELDWLMEFYSFDEGEKVTEKKG